MMTGNKVRLLYEALFVIILSALCGFTWCADNFMRADDAIALCMMNDAGSERRLFRNRQRIPPAIKPVLKQVISDPKTSKFMMTAVMGLSLISEDSDIAFVGDNIWGKIKAGNWDSSVEKNNGLLVYFRFLSIMSRRGSEAAESELIKLYDAEEWSRPEFFLFDNRVIVESPEKKLEGRLLLVGSLTYSNNADLMGILSARCAKNFSDKNYIGDRLDIDVLMKEMKFRNEYLYGKIKDDIDDEKLIADTRIMYSRVINDWMKKFGIIVEEERGAVLSGGVYWEKFKNKREGIGQVINEAGSCYISIREKILLGKFDDALPFLADDGSPIIKNALSASAAEAAGVNKSAKFKTSCEGVKALLEELERSQAVAIGQVSIDVFDRQSYVQSGDSSEKFSVPHFERLIRVEIPLIGSKQILIKNGHKISKGITVNREGELKIVMIKVGDRWHWNPFGW